MQDGTVMEGCFLVLHSERHLRLVHCHSLRPRPFPGTGQPDIPFVIVGDEAFPLKNYMMRLYPGRNLPGIFAFFCFLVSNHNAVFSPRECSCIQLGLSRARRIIENNLGILTARWRLFCRPIIADLNRAVLYSQAAIALHNYLRTTESSVYCPAGFLDGEDEAGNAISGRWRADEEQCSGLQPLGQGGSNMLVLITLNNFV